MSNLNKLYRNFIILQEDERGYSNSNDKTLSGYSKIEAKGNTCKISFYAQNLRVDDDYYILAICNKKDNKSIINLGKAVVSDNGKVEESKEYTLDNIAGLGINYDKISGAAIAKMKNEIPIIIMCGFINGEQPGDNWKNYKMLKSNCEGVKDKFEYLKKNDKKKKSHKHREEESNENEERIVEIKALEERVEKEEIKEEIIEEVREEIIEEIIEEVNQEIPKVEEIKEIEEIDMLEEKRYATDKINPFIEGEDKNNPFINEDDDFIETIKTIEVDEDINVENIRDEKMDRGYLNNKFDEYEDSLKETEEEFKIRGSVGEYFESLANNFEVCRNKFEEIKYCKWYKVPVGDLHEMCNMSNYNRYAVAYYPMLNYYPYIRKHKHFMLGYKCDKEGNLRYIVYGIPGMKNIDDQPYEGKTGFVTWVNDEDREGMGCWLMFYDFKNSTVVVPMQ